MRHSFLQLSGLHGRAPHESVTGRVPADLRCMAARAARIFRRSAALRLRGLVHSHAPSFSRRIAPELCPRMPPSKRLRAQGRSGAGLSHGPPATKNAGGRYHRFGRGHPDLPCAMVLRLIRALPGDRLSCPRHGRLVIAHLASAPGCQNHATSPSHRIVRPREQAHAATQCAHRIPHPTSVTIAKHPLSGTG